MESRQALNLINQAIASLQSNSSLSYLLPNEVTMLESLSFVPKQSIHYFNRQQALSLLMRFQMGIMLEIKASEE